MQVNVDLMDNESRQPRGRGVHKADEASKDTLIMIKINEIEFKRSGSGPEEELCVCVSVRVLTARLQVEARSSSLTSCDCTSNKECRKTYTGQRQPHEGSRRRGDNEGSFLTLHLLIFCHFVLFRSDWKLSAKTLFILHTRLITHTHTHTSSCAYVPINHLLGCCRRALSFSFSLTCLRLMLLRWEAQLFISHRDICSVLNLRQLHQHQRFVRRESDADAVENGGCKCFAPTMATLQVLSALTIKILVSNHIVRGHRSVLILFSFSSSAALQRKVVGRFAQN